MARPVAPETFLAEIAEPNVAATLTEKPNCIGRPGKAGDAGNALRQTGSDLFGPVAFSNDRSS